MINSDNKLQIEGFQLESLILPGCELPSVGIKIATLHYTNKKQIKDGYSIFLAHPNGLQKELFLPFTKKLLKFLNDANFENINTLTIVDMRNQGDSAKINQELIEGPFLWKYYALDNLEVIKYLGLNKKKLIGIGNSIGAVSLMAIESMFQPNIFLNIIAFEPPLFDKMPEQSQFDLFEMSKKRRGVWKDKEEARKLLYGKFFFKAWDEGVFELFMDYGFIETSNGEIRLKSTPNQEYKTFTDDFGSQIVMYTALKKVYCPVLLVHGLGARSFLPKEHVEDMSNQIPNCKRIGIKNGGHLIPFEMIDHSAKISSEFIVTKLKPISKSKL